MQGARTFRQRQHGGGRCLVPSVLDLSLSFTPAGDLPQERLGEVLPGPSLLSQRRVMRFESSSSLAESCPRSVDYCTINSRK